MAVDKEQYDKCNFCNKAKNDVEKLIVGDSVAICNVIQ